MNANEFRKALNERLIRVAGDAYSEGHLEESEIDKTLDFFRAIIADVPVLRLKKIAKDCGMEVKP